MKEKVGHLKLGRRPKKTPTCPTILSGALELKSAAPTIRKGNFSEKKNMLNGEETRLSTAQMEIGKTKKKLIFNWA